MSEQFASLVAKHRDRDSPILPIELPLQRLLDHADCAALQSLLGTVAGPWEALVATQTLHESLPKSAGIYMFVWRPPFSFNPTPGRRPFDLSQVLYVGKAGGPASANTLPDRYKEYRKFLNGNPEKLWDDRELITRANRLERYLTLRPLEYWYTVIEDLGEVDFVEDRLIKLLNPPLNKDRRPKLRARPAVSAFTRP